MALSNNSGDLFIANTLEEPIMKQYLDHCPKNATYISNTWAESIVDAINFNVETKTSTEINDATFISSYADETENSFHKEYFSMFVTYFSLDIRGSYSIPEYWGFQRKDFFWNNGCLQKKFSLQV